MSDSGEFSPDEASPEQLIAKLESMASDGLQSVLASLASALFPSGVGTMEQVTWPSAKGNVRVPDPHAAPGSEPLSAEEKARAAEQRFQTLVEQIPAVTFLAMLGEGRTGIYVSPHVETVLGFTQREWLENPFLWFRQLHPDDRKKWIDEFARGCRTGGPFREECRFLARDGKTVWIRGEARLIKDEQGRPALLQGVAFDITESKAAQETLLQRAVRVTEERYRDLVERVGAIVWEFHVPSRKFTFVSDGSEKILGFSSLQWLTDPQFWIKNVHPEDRAAVEHWWQSVLDDGGDREFEFRAITARGEVRWLHNKAHVPRSSASDTRALGLMLDVTQRKQTEEVLARAIAMEQEARVEIASMHERRRSAQELQASEERYRRIVDNAHEGIWLIDANAHTEFVNDRMGEILGYPAEKLIGTSFLDHVVPDKRDAADRHLRQLREGVSEDHDLSFTRSDGAIVSTILSTTPVYENGKYLGALKMVLDVTERRRLEHNLQQAQKMEAVGQLAGGVAHDFNNMLTAILGYSELAYSSLDEDNPVRADIAEIQRAGESASSLTRQLLAFSRKQILQPRIIDLNDVLLGMQKMLSRLIGEQIELNVTASPGIGSVKVDPGQMEQVILNLVVNARDAMPGGGTLLVETAAVDVDAAEASQHPGMLPGAYVLLSITDAGTGMSAETRARLFEPFFTTKEPGKGTGLGLATVYGIIKQSSGYIGVTSVLGVGTTFKVYLPRVEGRAENAARGVAAASRVGKEAILLVEDDPSVRRLAREALARAGYSVHETSEGEQALAYVMAHVHDFDLLLTDVVMPKMSGQEVAARVKAIRPDVKILFMSGYADNAVIERGLLDEGTAFLHKPFTPSTLTAKVRELLDAS